MWKYLVYTWHPVALSLFVSFSYRRFPEEGGLLDVCDCEQ